MSIDQLFTPDFSLRILRTMLHFLWQGCALGIAGAIIVRYWRQGASSLRYALLFALLLAMPLCAAVTFAVIGDRSATPAKAKSVAVVDHESQRPIIPSGNSDADTPKAITVQSVPMPRPGGPAPKVIPAMTPKIAPSLPVAAPPLAPPRTPAPLIPRIASAMLVIYFAGVLLMLVRLGIALRGGAKLRRAAFPVTSPALLAAFDRQLRLSGLGFIPILRFCRNISVPAVVGLFKPIVLLPVSITSGLSIAQIEMLFAHELAHIRRRDALFDLIQRFIESFLFFHPAVWYISRAIRLEREKCCDDAVVSRDRRNQLAYAGALVRMAEFSVSIAPSLAPALVHSAAGKPSQLRHRILRLIGISAAPREIYQPRGALLIAVMIAAAALLFGKRLLVHDASAAAPLAKADEKSPYRITYANGATAEVLAVSVVPSRNKPFWQPDGQKLIAPPYGSRGFTRGGKTGQAVYEVTVRLGGVKDAWPHLLQRAGNGIEIGYDMMPYNGAETASDLRVFNCTVPGAMDVLNFELGIACNNWETTQTFKTIGTYGQAAQKIEVFAPQDYDKRQKPDLRFRVQMAVSGDAKRVVAVDKEGKIHYSRPGLIEARDYHIFEAQFPDLPDDKVKEYRVQKCDYEWKAIKDIHLKPAGDWDALVARHRNERLMAQELKFKPADMARVYAALDKLTFLNVDDADTWGAAIRDLAEIGPPAVPAIVAELQRTSRPYSRSGLAIALRAIDDPRAIPGLIAALADCPFAPNDYGGSRVKDQAVLHFMLGVQRDDAYRGPEGPTLDLGRPVTEITIALERMTGHSEGNQHQRQNERRLYQDASARWKAWWDKNHEPFLAGLPVLRIAAKADQQTLTPSMPDAAKLAADLKTDPKVANKPVLDQWTLLHLAIAQDEAEIVRTLIVGGADVNLAGNDGWTPLHLAAALGQTSTVQLLLDNKADPRAKTSSGTTPLHAAVGECVMPVYAAMPAPSREIARLLIEKGADVKAVDSRGRTPLHGAVASAEADLTELILDRGGLVNAKDARSRTPLHRAVEFGNEAAVDLLLKVGADVNAKDDADKTPLRYSPYSVYYTTYNSPIVGKLLERGTEVNFTTAIALGSVEQVAAAIKKNPAVLREKPTKYDDRLPLQWAISRKSPELVKLLLDAGVDVNQKDFSGNTAIHNAIYSGDQNIIAMLIAAKADVDSKGQGDSVPLNTACHQLDVELVNQLLEAGAKIRMADPKVPSPLSTVLQSVHSNDRYVPGTPAEKLERGKTIVTALLDHGADPNERGWSGYTEIFWASGELAELLLNRGAKLNVVGDDGNTPLHSAAMRSESDLLEFLLKHNVPLEAKNKKSETPLHCAAGYFNSKTETLKLLLEHHANVSARDADGRTPLHCVVMNVRGSVAAATALLDQDADAQAKDKDGLTPLHHAAKVGRDDMIPLLLKYGAAVNDPDSAGKTPLDWATKESTKKLLIERNAKPGQVK